MKLGFSAQDELFRDEIATWLHDNLCGDFAAIRYRGGPGDEHMLFAERAAWEKQMAAGKWIGIALPKQYGGRGCSLEQQVIFHEEYARAGGPGRVGHIGEGLTAPTLIAFGSQAQQQRFLPPILAGEELWCQGYSEPSAGSDLANIHSKAVFDESTQQWLISGQKVWTSLAHEAHWCFVLARTEAGSRGNKGLGFFLLDLNQTGVDIRPITQLTGTSEFNEVFFDQAVCTPEQLVGEAGQGWKIAMGLLGYERGASTLGQQMLFQNELDEIIRLAKRNGAAQDPSIRQRLGDAHMGLKIMRYNSLRTLSSNAGDGTLARSALSYKLYWSTWHRNLGNLAMDVLGAEANLVGDDYQLSGLQSLFLFTRADTIYGGTNQIQRNIIAERALGLPRTHKPRD